MLNEPNGQWLVIFHTSKLQTGKKRKANMYQTVLNCSGLKNTIWFRNFKQLLGVRSSDLISSATNHLGRIKTALCLDSSPQNNEKTVIDWRRLQQDIVINSSS